ncbi:MAG: DUF3368 domain-containing protein [Euryarchaeota archaeon]|nr:DUF3368 domain-containing protein [Euryarchaeota archaeon]
MRILVDSSTLIALSKIGELDIVKSLFERVFITTAIEEEVLIGNFPETDVLNAAINEWIEVIDYDGDAGELRKYGLGLGEASLLLAAKREDRLVLDEPNARRFAESRGFQFTGLIGLLIAAVRSGKLTKERAVGALNRLAKSDFRVSSNLYLWAYEEIERVVP